MNPKIKQANTNHPNDIKSVWYRFLYKRTQKTVRYLTDLRKENSKVVNRYSLKYPGGNGRTAAEPSPVGRKCEKPVVN